MSGCRSFPGRFGCGAPPVLAGSRGAGRAERGPHAGTPARAPCLAARLAAWPGLQRGKVSPFCPCPGCLSWLILGAPSSAYHLGPPPARGIGRRSQAARCGRPQGSGSASPLSSPGGPRTPGCVGSLSHIFKIGSRSTIEKMARDVLLSLTDVQAGCILALSEWPSDTIHGIHAGREPRARMNISGGRRAISPAFYIARRPRCARGRHPGDALGDAVQVW